MTLPKIESFAQGLDTCAICLGDLSDPTHRRLIRVKQPVIDDEYDEVQVPAGHQMVCDSCHTDFKEGNLRALVAVLETPGGSPESG